MLSSPTYRKGSVNLRCRASGENVHTVQTQFSVCLCVHYHSSYSWQLMLSELACVQHCLCVTHREIYGQDVVFVPNCLTFAEVHLSFFGGFSTPCVSEGHSALVLPYLLYTASFSSFFLHLFSFFFFFSPFCVLLWHPPICFTLYKPTDHLGICRVLSLSCITIFWCWPLERKKGKEDKSNYDTAHYCIATYIQ